MNIRPWKTLDELPEVDYFIHKDARDPCKKIGHYMKDGILTELILKSVLSGITWCVDMKTLMNDWYSKKGDEFGLCGYPYFDITGK